MRLSPCVLVQPDGWARGEREGYGEPCDVTSLSLSMKDAARARRVGDARCLPPSPGQGLRPLVLAP